MLTPSIPVLCYHDIFDGGGHSPACFAEHLDAILDAGFKTISARQLVHVLQKKRAIEPKTVVITFDDGHISSFFHAAPELEKRGMTGVFFALTDFIENASVRELREAPFFLSTPDSFKQALIDENYSQFINSGEIKSLLSAGHEVYAHGCRHQGCFKAMNHAIPMGHPLAHWTAWSIYTHFDPNLPVFEKGSAYVYNGYWPNKDNPPCFTQRSTQERRVFCQKDFVQCFERIRELNTCDEQLFCWPWGSFDALSEQELQKAGFCAAFTLERWSNSPGTNPFRINRIGVGSGKDGQWIQKRLAMYSRKLTARVFFKKYHTKPVIKHILYTTDSKKLSGGARQLVNNAQAMLDLGLKVSVLLPTDSAIESALPKKTNVITCRYLKKPLSTALLIKKLIKKHDVDIVHTFHNKTYKAGILAKLLGAQFKLFIGRGVIFTPNPLFGLWARIANGMIVNSFACAASLGKIMVPQKRINVVYNSFIPQVPLPDRSVQKKRGLRILYVGNEAPAKGLDTFLLACNALIKKTDLRDLEFVVAGAQSLKPFQHIISHKVAKRLTNLGLLSHTEVFEQMVWADILLLSSRQESLPNILAEAFYAGLPVVCTKAGGIPELVRHGQGGLLCELEDYECLATQMETLLSNFAERRRMGRINQEIVCTVLHNRRKGLELLEVYHGQHKYEPLPLNTITAKIT